MNTLTLIKKQIEKQARLHDAQISHTAYRGVKYDAEGYKAKVLADQEQNRRHELMYRGIKVVRPFASKS